MIRTRLYDYFKERHGLTDAELAADPRLQDFISSLALLELLLFVQQELGVELDLVAISPENFGTPSLVARYVEAAVAARDAAKQP